MITSVVADGKKTEFKGAMGIYVDKNGLIYISDTENGRVLACDIDGNLKKQYLLPDSRLIPIKEKTTMGMHKIAKMPSPEELKEEMPLSEEAKQIKAARDKEIRDVFTGASDKFLVIDRALFCR